MRVLFEKTLYKNHSGSVGSWKVEALAEDREPTDADPTPAAATIRLTHTKRLGGKEVESLDPVKGKNIGRKNETSPSEQAVSEAESRAAKQILKGYVENIEDAAVKSTNSLGKKKPMLAVDIDKIKVDEIDWDNAYVQPKLDGHRCLNDGGIYSRGGKAHNVAHVTEALHAAGLIDCPLDGELYIHGVNLQKIGSLITKHQEQSLDLVYWVYDWISDEPFIERYTHLIETVLPANSPVIRLVPCHKVTSMKEALEYTAHWEAEGYEGGILRISSEGYEDDKRSKQLGKLKKFTDLEVTVTGYTLGTPKIYKGEQLEQPILDYKTDDGKVGKVTVMGDMHEKHAELADLISGKSIGRRLTIEHFGLTNKGVPNIATAKCWYNPL